MKPETNQNETDAAIDAANDPNFTGAVRGICDGAFSEWLKHKPNADFDDFGTGFQIGHAAARQEQPAADTLRDNYRTVLAGHGATFAKDGRVLTMPFYPSNPAADPVRGEGDVCETWGRVVDLTVDRQSFHQDGRCVKTAPKDAVGREALIDRNAIIADAKAFAKFHDILPNECDLVADFVIIQLIKLHGDTAAGERKRCEDVMRRMAMSANPAAVAHQYFVEREREDKTK